LSKNAVSYAGTKWLHCRMLSEPLSCLVLAPLAAADAAGLAGR